jgi:acetylornithine deacetylase
MLSLNDAIEMLARLVAFDTTPEKSAAPILAFVESLFKARGVESRKILREDGKLGALWGRLGPRVEGGIVLSGHLDVVSVEGQNWATDPFKLKDRGDKLYGRGACDMKGFVACALSALSVLAKQTRETPLYFAFTTDEETENRTIHDLVKLLEDEPKPRAVIVGEPTEMNVVTAHKGTHVFFIDITGRAAHSSRPDLGISAIEIAHDILSYIRSVGESFKKGPLFDSFDPPYATNNIGQIHGGTASNIIPEHCALVWQLRPILNAQATQTEDSFRAFLEKDLASKWPEARIDLRVAHCLPALEPRATNEAAALAQKALPNAKMETAPFATEAGVFQESGLDVAICGPGSVTEAHKPDEFVAKAQLSSCLGFLEKITAP